jgi:drug/metabolite transporter (DMT)-like permease
MSFGLALSLTMLVTAAMHAAWNLFVKGDVDRLSALTAMMAGGGLLFAPVIFFVPPPDPASWPFIALSIATHVGYYVFLLAAYRHGDLSLVYPIARGCAPLLVAVGGFWVAGEALNLWQSAGVALLSAGIASLALERGWPLGKDGHPALFALITACFIAGYSLTDGLGVRHSGSPLGYIAWLFLLEAIPLLGFCLLLRRQAFLAYLRARWPRALAGAVLSSGGYGIAIWAMSVATMASIVSLRETSVLFGAAFGALFLGERFGWRRILAAVAVVGGNLLLHLA